MYFAVISITELSLSDILIAYLKKHAGNSVFSSMFLICGGVFWVFLFLWWFFFCGFFCCCFFLGFVCFGFFRAVLGFLLSWFFGGGVFCLFCFVCLFLIFFSKAPK